MKTTLATEKIKTAATTIAEEPAEISKISVYCIAISSGFIGCWAVACLIAGLVTSGGPVELVSNLLKAITG